jgi:hypothetical protein
LGAVVFFLPSAFCGRGFYLLCGGAEDAGDPLWQGGAGYGEVYVARYYWLTESVFIVLDRGEFFIYIFKLFYKNIRWIENFTLFTTIRREPRWPWWPTAVSGLTVVAQGGSDVAVGYAVAVYPTAA